ncbi:type I-B CRISPR-associated protein Cas5 [Candidatus Altiarchaeales archaeon WOR_SM1_SCG]|nr:type I-B CRISPR-associated protein Cas5 [Candidatus Altiarchaeales archaeon WOR_SM1_SCG]
MVQEQNIKKVLVFDVWGDYAHFRIGYTTTSPLTFSIPPRTALCGLIGAILGLEKENNEYLKNFTLKKAKIGLKLFKENPVKKVTVSENLIDTTTSPKSFYNIKRTRIRFEFLKDPRYRIYFLHSDSRIYNQLKKNLMEHKSVYTPCLGISEHIANFDFVGEFDIDIKKTNDKIPIHSAIPTEKLRDKKSINFDSIGEYFSVRLPVEMDQERVIKEYSDVLFERNGNPIELKIKEPYYEINYNDGEHENENIVFIE